MQHVEVLTIQGFSYHLTISKFSHLHGTQKTFIMKSLLLPLILLTLFSHSLLAQVNVTGKVTDVNGQPLFGVTVAEKSTNNGDYTDALKALAALRSPVDSFFEDVMVMTEEPLLRQNRLNLLAQLGQLLNGVADISRLAA